MPNVSELKSDRGYEKSFMFTSERKPESSWMTFPPSQTLDKEPLPGFAQEQCVECSQFLKPGQWVVAQN
ncbi:hypothetical protein E5288_WYG022845 [Bos mutus]|uniref:Uncharacterized protein n=1 Tax=Bos mutus TaxID=72004 RepID=A0A6B0S5X1_9CETA|nr:hypothetical protein [Bos mutus]